MPDYIIRALFVLTGLMLLYELAWICARTAHPAARALLHALMGAASLLTANALGAPFGVGLGLNAVTLPVCAALGAPGTALLWALRYML